ncbi:MAG: PAS domain S-box protein [Acidobacteriota bacterium]
MLLYPIDSILQEMPTPLSITIVPDGRFVFVNQRFLEATGLREEEIIGRTVDEIDLFTWPISREEAMETIRNNGYLDGVHFSYINKRGEPIDALCNFRLIDWQDQKYLICISNDISTLMKAEKEKKETRNQYHAIFESTGTAVGLIDNSGVFQECNHEWERVFGFLPCQKKMHFNDVIHDTNIDLPENAYFAGQDGLMAVSFQGRITDSQLNTRDVIGTIGTVSAEKKVVSVIDVTGEQVTSRLLQEKLHFLERLFLALPLPLFVKDTEGNYIDCNPAFEAFLGRPRDEIVGCSTQELSPPDLADNYLEMDHRLFAERGFQTYDADVKSNDGSLHNVVFSKACLLGEDGEPTGLIGVVMDVTEIQRMGLEIDWRQRQVDSILNLIPGPAFMKDVNSRYTAANDFLCRIIGKKRDEVVGKTIFEVLPEIAAKGESEEDRFILQKKETRPAREFDFVEPDGGKITVVGGQVPVFDKDGEIRGIAGFSVNITELKQTQTELAKSEATYSSIFKAANDAIIVLDPDTIRVLDANPKALEWYGYSLEELRGMEIEKVALFDPDNSRPRARHKIELAKQTGSVVFEWVNKSREGRLIKTQWNLAYTEIEGQGRLIAVVRDITEQERLREERERITAFQNQVHKMVSLSAMAAGIVHEIGQPLNAIVIMLDTLKYYYKRNGYIGEDKVLEVLDGVTEATERIDSIIKHVRALAGAGSPIITMTTDLNEAVISGLSVISTQLSAHGITLQKKIWSEPLPVAGDQAGLEGVIINLIVNAMQELDQVDRRKKKVICQTRRENGQAVFEVADNGRGIAPELRNKVFEPFFSTKSESGGMGMGLAIIQSIVISFGGQVVINDDYNEGTMIRVLLPISDGDVK